MVGPVRLEGSWSVAVETFTHGVQATRLYKLHDLLAIEDEDVRERELERAEAERILREQVLSWRLLCSALLCSFPLLCCPLL